MSGKPVEDGNLCYHINFLRTIQQMTYIKKCNRCGKEIAEQANDNELHFTKQRNTKYGYDKLMHLCDGCLKDFDEFMMVKFTEKEEKDFSFIPSVAERFNDRTGRIENVKEDKGFS